MNEQIFRKKSLDKIKSPENLSDYVRVTNPGLWLLLAAVIVLLTGAVIWGAYGHIETVVEADMHIKDGKAFCYVSSEEIGKIEKGMAVRSGKTEGRVCETEPEKSCVQVEIELANGHYDAEIVTESIKPLSFVLN